MGAGASAVGNTPVAAADDTGPAAAPELNSSTIARWGLVRCLSQRSGKNTPAIFIVIRKV